MKHRLLPMLILSALAGIMLTWASVSVLGLLVVFAVEHRYFGMPIHLATLAEMFLAWVPLGIVMGVAIAKLLPEAPVRFSFAVVLFAVAALCIPALVSNGNESLQDLIQAAAWTTFSCTPFLFAVPVATVLARRLWR